MKLLKVLVVTLVMAAMVTPVIAEDRLSLSGEMRVRAFHTDYENNDSTDTWVNQRLRIAGKIAVAEGVSVTFRTDITEGTNWGDESTFQQSGTVGPIRTNGNGSGRSGAQQQWDRAHLDISKGMFHLRAGQQYYGTGGTFAVDTQDNGLVLNIVAGVPVAAYVIVDDNNSETFKNGVSNNEDGGDDAFLYGLTLTPKFGEVATKFFAAGYKNDDSVIAKDLYLLGASASMNIEAVKLFGEIDFFDGDHSDTVDAFGTQLFLDASMAATDALSFGGQFFYALGDDEDAQYTRLGNGFNSWDPIFDVGTSLSNEEIALWATKGEVFDFSDDSQGVVGGRLYTSFKVSDSLSFGASAAYLTVEDDHTSDDTLTALAAGMVYKVAENASFQLQLQHSNYDTDPNVGESDDEDIFQAGTGIFVTF